MDFQGPRNRFLARPFWRDYVVACVLIGSGFTTAGIGAPNRDPVTRRIVIGVGALLLGAGAAIFVCAVTWSLVSTLRSFR